MNGSFVFNLKKRLYDNIGTRTGRGNMLFLHGNNPRNVHLNECTMEDIFPHLLVNPSIATIGCGEKMWIAASMLTRFLETFTNSLVAMENDRPVGMVGGKEFMEEFSKDPSYSFFTKRSIDEVMNKSLYIATPTTKVDELLKKMKRTKRDFALIQNEEKEFSTISARRLLEVGVLCNTRITVSDMPRRLIHTFNREDTIDTIMEKMILHNTEILILENTPRFVNPQIILQKIVELNYLDNVENFLDLKATVLNLKNGKIVSENTTVPEMCRIMLSMKHSFVMTSNNVLTPWDILMALGC